jgi:hypothetical protein
VASLITTCPQEQRIEKKSLRFVALTRDWDYLSFAFITDLMRQSMPLLELASIGEIQRVLFSAAKEKSGSENRLRLHQQREVTRAKES